MKIDFGKIITAGDKQLAADKAAREGAVALRRAAYQAESDPLRFELEYDARVKGVEPDYSAWLISVATIKARFPLPASAEGLDT
ncbi:hypothetical protein [Pseudomonas reactans]|uniref:hypothetical protein n=1 Tax=Pseudomonas reactans TaxID=117680 RepID=UPI0015A202C7|nr:hypothetical protein [Pseudomonas reactans]NWA68006.1 hypothetical protein [Pseudomonas reactans]